MIVDEFDFVFFFFYFSFPRFTDAKLVVSRAKWLSRIFPAKNCYIFFFSIVQLINLRGNVLRVIFPISCITNILQYIKKKKKEKEFQEFHSLPSIPFQASFKKFFLELLTINYFVQRNFLNFTLKIMSDPIYQGLAKDTRKRGVKFELIKLSSSS